MYNNLSEYIDLDELLRFIFPSDLQHPSAAARLFIFVEYGPLINGELRSGPGRKHVVSVKELDAMCIQFEREDVMAVYVSKRKLALLTSEEQEMILQQSDSHLKMAKGLFYTLYIYV